MGIFEPVVLTWKGEEHTIPPDQVLRCIAAIEDVLPLGALAQANRGQLKLARLAQAFAVALRFAGAKVTDEEVYAGLFEKAGAELAGRAQGYVIALQAMMIPPEHLRSAPGKPEAAGRRAASSRKPTGSRSGKAG